MAILLALCSGLYEATYILYLVIVHEGPPDWHICFSFFAYMEIKAHTQKIAVVGHLTGSEQSLGLEFYTLICKHSLDLENSTWVGCIRCRRSNLPRNITMQWAYLSILNILPAITAQNNKMVDAPTSQCLCERLIQVWNCIRDLALTVNSKKMIETFSLKLWESHE